MKRLLTGIVLIGLAACGSPTKTENKPANTATVQTPSVDAEFEQLKTTKGVDACAWLTTEKLAAVYPKLKFEVHQKLEPRMSGYAWDSRCVYWAGVGTVDFAKDVPTHTVEIFVFTSVSEEKAKSKLASRQESATSTTNYQAQSGLGANAYSVVATGVASLFFVKGQSEVQINVSSLDTPSEEKIKNAIALAQSL